jgi:hypothetical protein
LPPNLKVFSLVPRTSRDIDGLKILVAICAAGLLVSLLFAIHGVDLGTDFY